MSLPVPGPTTRPSAPARQRESSSWPWCSWPSFRCPPPRKLPSSPPLQFGVVCSVSLCVCVFFFFGGGGEGGGSRGPLGGSYHVVAYFKECLDTFSPVPSAPGGGADPESDDLQMLGIHSGWFTKNTQP